MHEPLFQTLDAGAWCVTATRRLAAHLRGAYHRRQRAAGLESWPTPKVLPLSRWMQELWNASAERAAESGAPEPETLLDDTVALALWETIVRESREGAGLLQPERAAELARHAYTLMHAWRVPLPPPAGGQSSERVSEEVRAFRAWAAAFDARCRDERWLDAARLPERLIERLRAGNAALPARVVHAGYDELTPQDQALLAAIAEAGCPVEPWQPPALHADAGRLSFPDPAAELDAVARWARALLEAKADGADGEHGEFHIGIVMPQPEARRREVERVFHDLLDPGEPLRDPSQSRPFNLSAPLTLLDEPLVRAALDFLAPKRAPLPFAELSAVLRSPYLAGAERERSARARFDVRLRSLGAAELSWEAALRIAEQDRTDGRMREGECETLLKALRDAIARDGKPPSRQTAAQWAEHFLAALRHDWGWPNAHLKDSPLSGDRVLTSEEYQAVEAFRAMLGAFTALDAALPELTQSEAVARLRWLAQQTEHQPKRDPAPVQVLGILEAGGLQFSHLWLMGFDDSLWPRGAAPNPFLPLAAQRAANVPRSSPAREFESARGQTARLLASSPRIVASHAERDGDRELAVSPLLAHLPALPAQAVPRSAAATHRALVHAAGGTEPLLDTRVPPLPPGEYAGGVRLFKDQSDCAFRAFAAHRLNAEALEVPAPGLAVTLRGRLIHKGLEIAWEGLRTQAALKELDGAGVRERAERAAREAIEREARYRPHLRGSRALDLERSRIAGILADVLNLERARAAFEVREREERRDATFGGVTVAVRVDRIDRVLSGGHVVIDYKSGDARVENWTGERPEEPQLPLYCASAGLPIAGLAFVRASRKALNDRAASGAPRVFVGLARDESLFPKAAFPAMRAFGEGSAASLADADAAIATWSAALHGLGDAYRAGDAAVRPRALPGEPRSPCTYCPLPTLCRVHEGTGRTLPPDEEEGDA